MNDCHSRKLEFAARLPNGYRFTASHFWFCPSTIVGRWRIGISEFALRMLGDLVVVEFEALPGKHVQKGDVLGLIEGFKALSDLYSIGTGVFERGNPELAKGLTVLEQDPYGEGWLYELSGELDPNSLDATAYRELLGITLSKVPCPDEKLS